MVTDEVINRIMSGKTTTAASLDGQDEYSEKLHHAAESRDVPEWVRRAAQRIISLADRRGVNVDKISFEDIGLGLHDNIVESAIIGDEGQRFYLIVMNFEQAIINMRGL